MTEESHNQSAEKVAFKTEGHTNYETLAMFVTMRFMIHFGIRLKMPQAK